MQSVTVDIPSKQVKLQLSSKSMNLMQFQHFIDKERINIKENFKHGEFQKIIKKKGFAWMPYFYDLLNITRKQRGIKTSNEKGDIIEITTAHKTDITLSVLADNQFRDSPKQEKRATEKIIYALHEILPIGGIGIMMGTQSAFSACRSSLYNYLCADNLSVADHLNYTSHKAGLIAVGNSINHKKAMLKGYEWASTDLSKDYKIQVRQIDKNAVIEVGEEYAKKYKLVKLILMNSGIFQDCKSSQLKRKRDYPNAPELDLNFKEASLFLTRKYNNMHILAMAREDFVINIKHIHNGFIKDVQLPKKVKEKDLIREDYIK